MLEASSKTCRYEFEEVYGFVRVDLDRVLDCVFGGVLRFDEEFFSALFSCRVVRNDSLITNDMKIVMQAAFWDSQKHKRRSMVV